MPRYELSDILDAIAEMNEADCDEDIASLTYGFGIDAALADLDSVDEEAYFGDN